jgi:hypothetical protein
MFKLKPDFETVLERYEAWWACEIVDRPLASITYPVSPDRRRAVPTKAHQTLRDRWMDTEYVVKVTAAHVHNTVYYADALPVAFPNLGPEVFSAFYGCPLVFGETTSWSEPILEDWSPASTDALRLDEGNVYFRKILELTDALLEVAANSFIVGYTDLHPGGDALAAFRDPEQLCVDMVEHPEAVKALCDRITDDFLTVYDLYHRRLQVAGMPSSTWLNATCRGRFHVPSNDFSCMISERMFQDTFVPGIERECRHMDRNIYHLDGPQALRFLDLLLAMPEIHAIQWVPGAGYDHWADWIEVYQRIQAAGKAFCLYPPVDELDDVFDVLRPEGAWLIVRGVRDAAAAEAALAKISRWGS